MQDLLLLVVVAITFIFGFFVMRGLDSFLESNFQSAITSPRPEEYDFRIGVSDPLVVDSIADILEAFMAKQNGTSVFIFSGTAEQLLRELSVRKLDVIFLPVNMTVPKKAHYDVMEILLNYTPVITKYSELVIEPITSDQTFQKVLWNNSNMPSITAGFIKYLKTNQGEKRKVDAQNN